MNIRNSIDRQVDYEIRGGDLGHMIGKGWLEAGEEDIWEPHTDYDVVKLRFCDDDGTLCELEGDIDAQMELVADGKGYKIEVS